MRKLNAVLGPVMIVLLLIHVISGVFQLASIIPGGSLIRQILSMVLITAVTVHALIGVILTISTLRSIHKAGGAYLKNNESFWISRISGFVMLVLIIYHVMVFSGESGEVFRLQSFGWIQLAAHILLVLALAIHLVVNIRPLFISLGIENRKFIKDIMFVLVIIMLLCALGFIYYYLRWNILWRY